VGVQHKRRSLVVLGLRDKGTMVVPVHRGLMVAAVAAKDRLVRLLHQVKAAMVWRRRLLVQALLMLVAVADAPQDWEVQVEEETQESMQQTASVVVVAMELRVVVV